MVPPEIIKLEYFSKVLEKIETLNFECDELNSKIEELEVEYGGEDGPFEEAKSDAGNITKSLFEDQEIIHEHGLTSNYNSIIGTFTL